MKDKFYDSLAGLLSIKSVAVDSDKEGAPFGDGCRDALDYMLGLCDSFGFRTKKIGGGLMGYAEIGEGDEIIAFSRTLTSFRRAPGGSIRASG